MYIIQVSENSDKLFYVVYLKVFVHNVILFIKITLETIPKLNNKTFN